MMMSPHGRYDETHGTPLAFRKFSRPQLGVAHSWTRRQTPIQSHSLLTERREARS